MPPRPRTLARRGGNFSGGTGTRTPSAAEHRARSRLDESARPPSVHAVPPETPAGWTLRLIDLLGARLDEITEQHLEALVTGNVPEDADLDFKRDRYGNNDQQRRDLAGDLAAMGNARGGLIVVGIRDENDVAVELTPVELVDGEEARSTTSSARSR